MDQPRVVGAAPALMGAHSALDTCPGNARKPWDARICFWLVNLIYDRRVLLRCVILPAVHKRACLAWDMRFLSSGAAKSIHSFST